MTTDDGETAIERTIQAKGLNAPRLTPRMIDETILTVQYHHFVDTTLVVCALTLRNGYVVTGEAAAASPENFDLELGQRIAFGKAREKIWPLEGYRLKEWLYNQEKEKSA